MTAAIHTWSVNKGFPKSSLPFDEAPTLQDRRRSDPLRWRSVCGVILHPFVHVAKTRLHLSGYTTHVYISTYIFAYGHRRLKCVCITSRNSYLLPCSCTPTKAYVRHSISSLHMKCTDTEKSKEEKKDKTIYRLGKAHLGVLFRFHTPLCTFMCLPPSVFLLSAVWFILSYLI